MGVRSQEECVSKCESCGRCNFVSFSQSAGECSYFAKCEIPLQRWHGGSAFRTVQVRKSVPFVNHSIHRPNAQDPRGLSRPDEREWCGRPALRKRSYLMPAYFPYMVSTRMIMEHAPNTCDFYATSGFCQSQWRGMPVYEAHMGEAVASVLLGRCLGRCRALDIGANNGWLALRMAALGANVTAVEPQVDLARALQESGELNCWGDRLRAYAAYVEVDPAKAALGTMKSIPGYRVGGRRNDLQFPPVPPVSLDQLLLHEAGGCWDLIKLDADGPEGEWLARIEHHLSEGTLCAHSILVECNGCMPKTLHALQHQHKYTAFLLDGHTDYHFVDWRGIDVLNPGSDEGDPEFLQSLYSVRLMRHVYLVHHMSKQRWERAFSKLGRYANHYLFTREPFLELRVPSELQANDPEFQKAGLGRLPYV